VTLLYLHLYGLSIASVLHAGSFMLQANLQSPFWKEKASTRRVPHDYAFVQQAA